MENKKEIVFEEQGQDLMSMVIEHGKGIGTILEVKLKSLEHLYKGSFVNPESLVVGQQLEILNFKERCSDFIKYPIREIKEVV